MNERITDCLARVLGVVAKERQLAITAMRFSSDYPSDQPSRDAEDALRREVVGLAIHAREEVLRMLFPRAAGPSVEPVCLCGICRDCWERELVAAVRGEREMLCQDGSPARGRP